MARTLGQPGHVELASGDMTAIRSWLRKRGGHPELLFPAGLLNQPVMGCSVLDWQGTRVTLLCFKVGPPGEAREAHLLVVDQGRLPGAPQDCTPLFRQDGAVASYAWTDGLRDYVLAAKGGQEDVSRLF